MKASNEKPYEHDEYFKKWLVGLSDRTKENYSIDFNDWWQFIKMSPTQQIEKRIKDTRADNMADRMFFEQKFLAYKEHLVKRGTLSEIAVKTKLISVASFFSRNGLGLNLKRGDWETSQPQEVKTEKFKMTKDDLRSMYTHGNTRDRALLLVLGQSGFSEVDVSCMKIEQMKGIYENLETEHYFIEKPSEKTHEVQVTCLSYEAAHDLKAWLQERGNPSEGYLFISTN